MYLVVIFCVYFVSSLSVCPCADLPDCLSSWMVVCCVCLSVCLPPYSPYVNSGSSRHISRKCFLHSKRLLLNPLLPEIFQEAHLASGVKFLLSMPDSPCWFVFQFVLSKRSVVFHAIQKFNRKYQQVSKHQIYLRLPSPLQVIFCLTVHPSESSGSHDLSASFWFCICGWIVTH